MARPVPTYRGPSVNERSEALRCRLAPSPGDPAYPHLVDLRDAVRDYLRDAKGVWLDYGAGTSPYRTLLPDAELRTADMAGSANGYPPDYVLEPDGRCPVPDGTFDGVLSTQVLEHVPEPRAYLREAFRVLKPDGELVLTTHGVWKDHGGLDLWRWTAAGLRMDVEAAGFAVSQCQVLTGGRRAALHLVLRNGREARWPGRGPAALLLRAVRRLDRLRPKAFDRYADRRLADLRRSEASETVLYLVVVLRARRPGPGSTTG